MKKSVMQRARRRIVGYIIIFVFLVNGLVAVPHTIHAQATIIVGDECTLVDAITAANTDEAVGNCPAGEGDDIIELTDDVVLTEVAEEDNVFGSHGLPVINTTITINGNGFTIERAPDAPEFRVMALDGSGDLTLNNVIIRGGQSQTDGAGILSVTGTLTIDSCTITNNSALWGGGVAAVGGNVTISNSTISGNSAMLNGGGIHIGGSVATIEYSTISENTASVSGGGISNSGGDITMEFSTVFNNVAVEFGGGIFNSRDDPTLGSIGIAPADTQQDDFTLTIIQSVLFGNTANVSGGGIANTSLLGILNSTVSGNSAAETGGGIYSVGTQGDFMGGNPPFLVLMYVTVASNVAEEDGGGLYLRYTGVAIYSSIIVNDPYGDCSENWTATFSPPEGAVDFNRDSDGSCGDSLPITGFDLELADNGGPTLTHALLEGSNAIDGGIADYCASLKTDQRGASRDEGCDIGAFEFGGQLDLDEDGILDVDDNCPIEVNEDQADGDEDGVGDVCDACPDEAGAASASGCPDADEDSVADAEDNCPTDANTDQADVDDNGVGDACQDTDDDGVVDSDDLCITEPGTIDGCPDTDEDGISDAQDACPDLSGMVSAAGCPDADEDGLQDADDECPDDWGLPEVGGCLYIGTVSANVNLREGPGTNFDIAGTASPGDELAILGRNEAADWLRIRRETGDDTEALEAWIALFLITTEAPVDQLPIIQE